MSDRIARTPFAEEHRRQYSRECEVQLANPADSPRSPVLTADRTNPGNSTAIANCKWQRSHLQIAEKPSWIGLQTTQTQEYARSPGFVVVARYFPSSEAVAERQEKADRQKGAQAPARSPPEPVPFCQPPSYWQANRLSSPRVGVTRWGNLASRKGDWLSRAGERCLSPYFGSAFACRQPRKSSRDL